jgi:chromosome segregation ATPase
MQRDEMDRSSSLGSINEADIPEHEQRESVGQLMQSQRAEIDVLATSLKKEARQAGLQERLALEIRRRADDAMREAEDLERARRALQDKLDAKEDELHALGSKLRARESEMIDLRSTIARLGEECKDALSSVDEEKRKALDKSVALEQCKADCISLREEVEEKKRLVSDTLRKCEREIRDVRKEMATEVRKREALEGIVQARAGANIYVCCVYVDAYQYVNVRGYVHVDVCM